VPESHRLLFDNDVTRVLGARIRPGEMTQAHTHRWPAVLYVLSLRHFVRRDGEGAVLVDTRKAGALPKSGTALWSRAQPPHTLENVDTFEISRHQHRAEVIVRNGLA
jgi:quercetin dioxygenase-like cupin family protein